MRLDLWERRLEQFIGFVPFGLLAISTVLSWLTDDRTLTEQLITAGLAGLTTAWLLWQPPPAGLYMAGLLVLIAALTTRSGWFAGFFAFTGYVHAWRFLPGRWKLAGVAGTAVITVTSFLGGLPAPTLSAILTYVLF